LVRPRFEHGCSGLVVGYSVALKPTVEGQRPAWYGGGRLSRELTLPRLRENWPQLDPDAVATAWKPQKTTERLQRSGRRRQPAPPELQERCARDLADLRERLVKIPADDRTTWAHAAREASGVFAAWSLRTEPQPGPLAETSRILARSGQLRRRDVQGRRQRRMQPARNTSALLLATTPDARAAVIIFQQLVRLSSAIADMHEAVGELDRARELQQLSRQQITTVSNKLKAQEISANIAPTPTVAYRPTDPGEPDMGFGVE
jgi:hypothetical protein